MSLFATPYPVRLDWASLVSASTPYGTATLHLFTNDLTPTPDNVVGDFTEATFTGYAAVSITWGTPYIDGQNNVHLPSTLASFLCSGGSGETVYGYFIKGTGGVLLGGARFDDAPRPIPGPGYGTDCTGEVIV